jgi:antitoxin component YwqK of YwqJK toxin-antitoxin module
MKKLMMIAVLVVSSVAFAQNIEPKFEELDGIVQATFYHDNGNVQQEGYYENGKLDGKWISYDQNGNKIAVGMYSNGIKVGNWFFWNSDGMYEVNYSKNDIVSITKWNKNPVAFRD